MKAIISSITVMVFCLLFTHGMDPDHIKLNQSMDPDHIKLNQNMDPDHIKLNQSTDSDDIESNESTDSDDIELNQTIIEKNQWSLRYDLLDSEKNILPRLPLDPYSLSQDEKDLLPGKWINSYIIDDVINNFIINNKKEDSIVYIPSSVYEYFCAGEDFTNISQLILESNIIEKDFILVTINTNPLEGRHWILGVIHLKYKKIIILDSLYGKERKINNEFNDLILLTALSFDVTSFFLKKKFEFNLNEWDFIYATDVIQQYNMYDCGLSNCINAYSLIKGIQFFELHSLPGRQWLFHNFKEFAKLKKNNPDHPYFKPNVQKIITIEDLTELLEVHPEHYEKDMEFNIKHADVGPLFMKKKNKTSQFKNVLKKFSKFHT